MGVTKDDLNSLVNGGLFVVLAIALLGEQWGLNSIAAILSFVVAGSIFAYSQSKLKQIDEVSANEKAESLGAGRDNAASGSQLEVAELDELLRNDIEKLVVAAQLSQSDSSSESPKEWAKYFVQDKKFLNYRTMIRAFSDPDDKSFVIGNLATSVTNNHFTINVYQGLPEKERAEIAAKGKREYYIE